MPVVASVVGSLLAVVLTMSTPTLSSGGDIVNRVAEMLNNEVGGGSPHGGVDLDMRCAVRSRTLMAGQFRSHAVDT